MALSHQPWYSIEEYHKVEEENPNTKFEYINGKVRAMTGGPYEHTKIVVNLITIINTHLEDRMCYVASSDLYVLPTGHDDPSYLPDITVTCNPKDYHPNSKAIQFPSLIVEVLSQSTELIDRTEKLRAYQACPSMQEYLIASTQRREIEAFRRGEDGVWKKTLYTAQDTILLTTIGLSIPMSTIYRRTGID